MDFFELAAILSACQLKMLDCRFADHALVDFMIPVDICPSSGKQFPVVTSNEITSRAKKRGRSTVSRLRGMFVIVADSMGALLKRFASVVQCRRVDLMISL